MNQKKIISVKCVKSSYNEPIVKSIQELVANGFEKLFFAVIVHGSIGTNEAINYSDFDGLLIIRDKYKNSLLLKKFIRYSMKQIYEFDPLQHHGWFILYESQLQDYPQTYFPFELFEFSSMIYHYNDAMWEITISAVIDYKKPFKRMAMSFNDKLEKGFRPLGMYQLKSFLSELMLLPALYYQAKADKVIFKKYSFELTKHDFSPKAWLSIKISSEIREAWHYKFIFSEWLFVRLKDRMFIKKYVRKYMAPQIPYDLKKRLNNQFYASCLKLVHEMNCRLNEL